MECSSLFHFRCAKYYLSTTCFSLLLVCVSRSIQSDSGSPWTVAWQAPLSMEFSRQESWKGLPFPSPGDLPDPGIEPRLPALQADSLLSEPPGKPWCLLLMCVQFLCHQICPFLSFIGSGSHASLRKAFYIIRLFLHSFPFNPTLPSLMTELC